MTNATAPDATDFELSDNLLGIRKTKNPRSQKKPSTEIAATDGATRKPAPADGATRVEPAPVEWTEEKAREVTDALKRDMAVIVDRLAELANTGIHRVLGYSSWYAYCFDEFGIGQAHAYRLRDAGKVRALIRGDNRGLPVPASETQLRPLYKLLRHPGEVVEALGAAYEDGPLTTDSLERAVKQRLDQLRKPASEAAPAVAAMTVSALPGLEEEGIDCTRRVRVGKSETTLGSLTHVQVNEAIPETRALAEECRRQAKEYDQTVKLLTKFGRLLAAAEKASVRDGADAA